MNKAKNQTALLRVSIIDDEPQIRRFLDISLRSKGYATLLASNEEDLVVLNRGVPDRESNGILSELQQWPQAPVIVRRVRLGEEQKIALLDAGTKDYVIKPSGTEEPMARIRAFLQAVGRREETDPVYDDGQLCIGLAQGEANLRGQFVPLTRNKFALPALRLREPGKGACSTLVDTGCS